MGSNAFGRHFRFTTWGESHGPAIGVVIDGCPAGLPISEEEIARALERRRPGKSAHTSPRNEPDVPQILSGVFEGKTTGAPISILIENRDVDSSHYEPLKEVLRPGHANYTYQQKYGVFDYRGGGRASARETAARVAAGAVAAKLLEQHGIQLEAKLIEVGGVSGDYAAMLQRIEEVRAAGDSVGGIIELTIHSLPVGLGDPIYEKLEANLAKAMMSLPASKGVEFGAGFEAARMLGSEHNDVFALDAEGSVITETNHAGGTLGGISTGMPLVLRVAFKPTSSIAQAQNTLNTKGEGVKVFLPEGSRHDPCVALRAVPVVESMGFLVIADSLLSH